MCWLIVLIAYMFVIALFGLFYLYLVCFVLAESVLVYGSMFGLFLLFAVFGMLRFCFGGWFAFECYRGRYLYLNMLVCVIVLILTCMTFV